MLWASVVVIGRILAESGSPPPDVHDPALLLIKRKDVVVGCTPGDAGMGGDAAIDAGDAGPPDAGPTDAGVTDAGTGDGGLDDAGIDGGMPDAGSCTMIPGDAVTMVLQPHVTASTDGTRFAVLLVTPERPIVELTSHVFGTLARVTKPRIEHRTVEVPDPSLGKVCSSGCESNNDGCGSWPEDNSWDPPGIGDAGLGDGGLVEEMIGPYQFVRAQPMDAAELAGWLDQLGYAYMPEDLDAVAPYIALGYHVVAMRIALDEPINGSLVPVALTWPGSELRVPAALGHGAVAPGTLTVYIAAEDKYALPGAKIRFAGRTSAGGAGYLTRNEITLDQNKPPEQDPIAHLSVDGDFQEVEVITKEVRVPVEVPCEDEGGGCCSDCSTKQRPRFDWGVIVVAVVLVLRRRRPSRRRDR